MTNIDFQQIKDLREKTGAGMNLIKEALIFAQGDEKKAIEFLKNKGADKATKREGREVNFGVLGSYEHKNSQVITVVEVMCETDFAAKSIDLKKFADEIALHFTAVESKYIDIENIDADQNNVINEMIAKELPADIESKPAEIKEKIMQGKRDKYYVDIVLMEQALFTDENIKVKDLLSSLVGKIGEKIKVTKISKNQVGKDSIILTAK